MQSLDPYIVSPKEMQELISLHAIRQWFTDLEIVQLTIMIAATIAWNGVEMSLA